MKKTHLFAWLCTITALLLLSACSHLNQNGSYRDQFGLPEGNYLETADHYLELAQTASDAEREAYQLKAAARLIQDGMYDRAAQLLQGLNHAQLNQDLNAQKHLLEGKLALIHNRPSSALYQLNHVEPESNFSQHETLEYNLLLATAYERSGKIVEGLKQRVYLNHLLHDIKARQNNERKIWNNLTKLSSEQIDSLRFSQVSSTLKAWLELAAISKDYKSQPQFLIASTNDWQRKNPDHPGNQILAKNQHATASHLPTSIKQVALLLPLEGKLSGPGKAVRDGFMSGYYNSHGAKPVVRVYDTSGDRSIADIYLQATADGADFVIGPLQKNKVTQLAKSGVLTQPLLALNYNETRRNTPAQFYQFGLSPNDEAQQVAIKAWEDGRHNAIIITPQGNWGDDIARAFSMKWLQNGGKIVDRLSYKPNADLSKSIKDLMKVDASNKRNTSIEHLVGAKTKFIPRRRKDVDMIFLIATPKLARQIKPLLKFYYAGDIPVYATSNVYSAYPSVAKDKDMNGLIFCDMPWVFSVDSKTLNKHQELSKQWPVMFNHYTRLYALGKDAYTLSKQLNRLALFPEFGVEGATGTLYLNDQRRINRSLRWAKITKGLPKLL